MREAYKDVMDRIEVTPEMQTRILKAIRDADIQGRSKRAVPMGRLAIAACLALLVAGAVALPKLPTKPPEKTRPGCKTGSGASHRSRRSRSSLSWWALRWKS